MLKHFLSPFRPINIPIMCIQRERRQFTCCDWCGWTVDSAVEKKQTSGNECVSFILLTARVAQPVCICSSLPCLSTCVENSEKWLLPLRIITGDNGDIWPSHCFFGGVTTPLPPCALFASALCMASQLAMNDLPIVGKSKGFYITKSMAFNNAWLAITHNACKRPLRGVYRNLTYSSWAKEHCVMTYFNALGNIELI